MNWVKKIFDRIGAPHGVSIAADISGLAAIDDAIYFDSASGVTPGNTTWPVGTAQNPSATIADVITMCTARNIKKIVASGVLTPGATMNGYTFEGVNQVIIDLNNKDVSGSSFYNCTITGTQAGAGRIYTYNCAFTNPVGLYITAYYSTLLYAAQIKMRSNTSNYFYNIYSTAAEFDFAGLVASNVELYEASGTLSIKNSTDAGNNITLTGDGIYFGSQVTNVAGSITVLGDAVFTPGGGGCGESDLTIYVIIGTPVATVSLDIAAIKGDTAALLAVTRAGNPQVKAATVDTHLASPRTAATCATQEVIIDSIIFSPHNALSADGGAFTGISIETDDTTVQTLVSQANGVKANLTAYAQIAWTGSIRLRVGKKITVTTYGAVTTANPSTCDVWITYHAVVDGGTL